MKVRILILCAVVIVLASCSNKSDANVIITGQIKGLSKGMLYLERLEDSIIKPVDSVKIDGDPNFTMQTFLDSPEVFYIYVKIDVSEIPDTRLAVFLEPGTINVNTTLNNFQADAVITGSANHDKFMEYTRAMERYTNRNLDLIKSSLEASQKGNDSLVVQINKQQDILIRSKYLATANFARNNGNYSVAPYLILTEVQDMSVRYMDTVYGVLEDSIKTSHYGKQLAALIADRKKEN